jgi:hypothetical protein
LTTTSDPLGFLATPPVLGSRQTLFGQHGCTSVTVLLARGVILVTHHVLRADVTVVTHQSLRAFASAFGGRVNAGYVRRVLPTDRNRRSSGPLHGIAVLCFFICWGDTLGPVGIHGVGISWAILTDVSGVLALAWQLRGATPLHHRFIPDFLPWGRFAQGGRGPMLCLFCSVVAHSSDVRVSSWLLG